MSNYTLFTPGPIDVPEEVLQETAQPLIYHREAQFGKLLAGVSNHIKAIIDGEDIIFFLTSSGTGSMEAACSNTLSTGDKPIVAVCGKFGERWLEICTTYGIEPIVIKNEFGRCIEPEQIESALKKLDRPTVIFTTLTETSTGALNDIQSFGTISKKYDSFLVVDAIAGVGADPCPQKKWHVDMLIGASQKALMAPPGISFISASSRIVKKIAESNLPRYYFNLQLYEKFLAKHQTPFTPAITILYGLKKGLEMILQTGVENHFEHHRVVAEYVRQRVAQMGLNLLSCSPSRALTVVKMPDHIDSTSVLQEVKEKHNVLFANGQANLRGKIIRIGHMGNYDVSKMGKALDALENVMKQRR